MASNVFDKVNDTLQEVLDSSPLNLDELEQYRIRFLGSKNVIKSLFSEIRQVPNERKKEFGQLVNELKEKAEAKFNQLKDNLTAEEETRESQKIDLTAPAEPLELGARHPVAHTLNRIVRIFERIGFVVAEEREIEDDWHNFSAMNTPEDHPARDMQDTFYLRDDHNLLLRTHTSSVQARVMTTQKPPIRIIAPGRVYRNETISARSHCQFHQVEGLYVDEGVSFADMRQTIYYYAREMYGEDVRIRLRPSYFPFTEPSAEVDVYWGLNSEVDYRMTKGTGWLEIMGCGMVDPAVLSNCGIDPEKYSGFAFGMGIERQTLFQYRINDIRLFFENDVRFLKQFSSAI